MGNHLNIQQGTGESTGWNLNPGLQAFGFALAQQRAQREAERQQLVQQMGAIDTTKLRDPDKEDYYNKFSDWQNSAIEAQNKPQNSREKMMAQGLALQKLNNLKSFVAESARQAAEHKQIGNMMLQDSFRHQFKPDAVDKWAQSNNLPMSDANFISDPSTLERQVDHEKLDKSIDSALEGQLKHTNNWSMTKVPDKMGDKTGTWVQQTNTIPFEGEHGVYHRLLNAYDASDDLKKSLADRYSNIQGQNDAETKALRVQQYATDMGWNKGYLKSGDPQFKPNYAPDKFYEHKLWWLQNNPAGPNQLTPSQVLINNMKTEVPGSGEKLLSLVPQGQYGNQKPHAGIDQASGEHRFTFPAQLDQKAVAVNQQQRALWKKQFPGEPYDATTPGFKLKDEVIVPAKIYRLNPNADNYGAQAAQMAAEQHINLTHLNQIEGQKGGRGTIPQVYPKQQTKVVAKAEKPKETSISKIRGLVGKQGFEGYTEDELIKYYKSLGYTIK